MPPAKRARRVHAPTSFADALRAVGKAPTRCCRKEAKRLHLMNYNFLCIDENIDIILYIPKYKAKILALFSSFDEVRRAKVGKRTIELISFFYLQGFAPHPTSFADALRAVGKAPTRCCRKEAKRLHLMEYSFLCITKYKLYILKS
ncbi:hypothetical protein [uncultured Brachyspira sp.]|uniref:hypothetical protein n=1 Tax=uncultured Brachyspira sp. TaxID=221953 RepID=UPI0032206DE0